MKKEIEKKIKAIDLYFEEGSKGFDRTRKILLAEDWVIKFIRAEEYELAEFMNQKRDRLLGIKEKKIPLIQKVINFFKIKKGK